jgi:hypothetical protein
MGTEEYDGPAVIHGPGGPVEVTVRLAGRFEPVDGRYHWGGRVAPHPDVAALARGGQPGGDGGDRRTGGYPGPTLRSGPVGRDPARGQQPATLE